MRYGVATGALRVGESGVALNESGTSGAPPNPYAKDPRSEPGAIAEVLGDSGDGEGDGGRNCRWRLDLLLAAATMDPWP